MNTRHLSAGSLCLAALLACVSSTAQSTPEIVSTQPAIGATDVDPALKEIRVTFDQAMAGGFSWTGGGDVFPKTTDKPRWEADKKTCVLPVELAEGKFYRIGINSSSHRNFQSESGLPAEFRVIHFVTNGAGPETIAKAAKPAIVSMEPANGATNVPASTTQLVVKFNQPMGGGFSWTKAEGTQPEGTGKPAWSEDNTSCMLPVTLKPGTTYSIGLNHAFANNFQSANGVPLEPVVWTFTTASE
jgi:methionine-rich copper-binding protein CopC